MALFLVAATLFLHGTALQGFWRWDDGMHLLFAAQHAPWEYFFLPKITFLQSSWNLAPWNALFYSINLSLFGLHPQGHYAHMLALIAIVAGLFYAVLRQWLSWQAALVGTLVLLLGKPTVHIAQGLMHGHYATGLALSLLAILGWCRFLNGGRATWLWLGALAYLLATTCKEIYVPLVVLLPFLPVGKPRQRVTALWPFVLVAIFYVGWRHAVLGSLMGGYRSGVVETVAGSAIQQLISIPVLLTGAHAAGLVELMIFLILLGLALRQRRVNWPLSIVFACTVLIPLIPLTVLPGISSPDRYLFLPWVAVAILVAVIWPRMGSRSPPLLLGIVLLLAMGMEHAREERIVLAGVSFHEILYRFAMTLEPETQGIFVGRDENGYQVPLLKKMRQARDLVEFGASSRELVVLTDMDLSDLAASARNQPRFGNRQLFRLSNDGGMQLLPDAELSNIVSGVHEAIRQGKNREMRVELTYEAGALLWKLKPGGNFQIFSSMGDWALDSEGSCRWEVDKQIEFSACHKSREGWIACSPRLKFDPREGHFDWLGKSVS